MWGSREKEKVNFGGRNLGGLIDELALELDLPKMKVWEKHLATGIFIHGNHHIGFWPGCALISPDQFTFFWKLWNRINLKKSVHIMNVQLVAFSETSICITLFLWSWKIKHPQKLGNSPIRAKASRGCSLSCGSGPGAERGAPLTLMLCRCPLKFFLHFEQGTLNLLLALSPTNCVAFPVPNPNFVTQSNVLFSPRQC